MLPGIDEPMGTFWRLRGQNVGVAPLVLKLVTLWSCGQLHTQEEPMLPTK
jgi:hypothetical protein